VLGKVFERFNEATPDQDFQCFLNQAWGLDRTAKRLAREYVEGFHAADSRRIGVHALAKAEAAAESDKATRQFRLMEGYSTLLHWFVERLNALQVPVLYNAVVKTISWKPGQVRINAQTPAGTRGFDAACVLVTVPLGVLQNRGPATIAFEPNLPSKESAINSLAMGGVIKVSLEFASRFWPVEDFGFIHSNEAGLPTWWSDGRGPILTGWAGGPRAELLSGRGEAAILSIALKAVSRLFKLDEHRVRELLVASHSYDWLNDPFSRGAYSYTPVRMSAMPSALAAPVRNTLFFAGEATDANGEQGTVQGALASGDRAAKEILAREQGAVLERRAA
jgi:monoamine oxidase